jgi:hypothetical protein
VGFSVQRSWGVVVVAGEAPLFEFEAVGVAALGAHELGHEQVFADPGAVDGGEGLVEVGGEA